MFNTHLKMELTTEDYKGEHWSTKPLACMDEKEKMLFEIYWQKQHIERERKWFPQEIEDIYGDEIDAELVKNG